MVGRRNRRDGSEATERPQRRERQLARCAGSGAEPWGSIVIGRDRLHEVLGEHLASYVERQRWSGAPEGGITAAAPECRGNTHWY